MTTTDRKILCTLAEEQGWDVVDHPLFGETSYSLDDVWVHFLWRWPTTVDVPEFDWPESAVIYDGYLFDPHVPYAERLTDIDKISQAKRWLTKQRGDRST